MQNFITNFLIIPEKNKIPLIKEWNKNGSREIEKIKNWMIKFPGCDWGIITGKVSGLLVMDIDYKNGTARGLENYEKLKEKYGSEWTDTYTVATPSGGLHLYYNYPDHRKRIKSCELRDYQHIEIKADGSKVSFGANYNVINKSSTEILDCPTWLDDMLPGDKTKNTEINFRNESLLSLAGTYRMRGLQKEEILLLLKEANNQKYADNLLPEKEIETIVNSICNYAEGQGFLTDIGNAERLAGKIKNKFIYCFEKKSWYYYNNGVWRDDNLFLIDKEAQKSIRNLFHEAAEIEKEDERKRLISHALRSESSSAQQSMIRLARPMLAVSANSFDNNKFYFNMQNGTLDLNSAEFRNHNPVEYHTNISPVKFDPDARCPLFEEFLKYFLINEEKINYVQQILGMCLSGDITEQFFYIFVGNGGNGKSTLIEVINHILNGYHSTIQADKLMLNKFGDNDPYIAQLKGARVVFCSESSENKTLDSTMIKLLTGGDEITTRQKYEKPITFKPEFKLIMVTNHRPRIKDDSIGIWRRVRCIPFFKQIDPDKKISQYEKILIKKEASGIFNWLYDGYKNWKKNGLICPESILNYTREYQKSEDFIQAFLEEKCNYPKNEGDYAFFENQCRTKSTTLYNGFEEYLENIGEKYNRVSQKSFSEKLQSKIPYIKKTKIGGTIYFKGITIMEETDDETNPEEINSEEIKNNYGQKEEEDDKNYCEKPYGEPYAEIDKISGERKIIFNSNDYIIEKSNDDLDLF